MGKLIAFVGVIVVASFIAMGKEKRDEFFKTGVKF